MNIATKSAFLITLGFIFQMMGHAFAASPVFNTDEAVGATPGTEHISWQPFHARYSVYHNGKLIGKSDIVMNFDGKSWSIKSESSGTHGLARLLRARENGYADGRIDQGRFIPDRYSQHTRVMGIDRGWTADFDWNANAVLITQDKEELKLDLGKGALDPLSITLEIRRRLQEKYQGQLRFQLVDEDKLKDQDFRVLDMERLDTSLGCIATTPVERIHAGNRRYTRAWHAPGLEFITVRMEHGKKDGDHIEMRIAELTLGETAVVPMPGCQSTQFSQITSHR
jgi:hypothetical protein